MCWISSSYRTCKYYSHVSHEAAFKKKLIGRAENQSGLTQNEMWAKYHKNELKSGVPVYPSGKREFFYLLNVPLGLHETHFKPLSSSRRGKLIVCGLDHSGSQPFILGTVFISHILGAC